MYVLPNFFSAFLGVLTARRCKISHKRFLSSGFGGMLVHTGGFGRLHILGKGVGRHGNNGHLRGIGFGQRTDGRGARFCILSVYNFKSLAVGMAVW